MVREFRFFYPFSSGSVWLFLLWQFVARFVVKRIGNAAAPLIIRHRLFSHDLSSRFTHGRSVSFTLTHWMVLNRDEYEPHLTAFAAHHFAAWARA